MSHQPDDRSTGIYAKYTVERIGDPDGKHAGCRFFVLDPQHDPIARSVLSDYAVAAFDQGYYQLAADLKVWLTDLEGGHDNPR